MLMIVAGILTVEKSLRFDYKKNLGNSLNQHFVPSERFLLTLDKGWGWYLTHIDRHVYVRIGEGSRLSKSIEHQA